MVGSLKSTLLVSGSEKTTDEVLEAVALLCGALPGFYRLDVGAVVDDAVLRDLVVIMQPAGVRVKRGVRYPQPATDDRHMVSTLDFEHIPPVGRTVQR